jgi:hypothetical protein
MNENIIAGLISGVVVTVLVLLTRQFWNSVIIPWFEDRVYKDVQIEGKWFGLFDKSDFGEDRQELITLDRRGHSIEGTMICTSGLDKGEKYSLKGSFRNLTLPLLYENSDPKKTDRGTITLKTMQSAEKLQGCISFYSCREDSIRTSKITWYRNQEELNNEIEARMKKTLKEVPSQPVEKIANKSLKQDK